MEAIYLSPHLDDAALSCGGRIAAQVKQGKTVRVINLFAGVPHLTDDQFSPYAQKQHRTWDLKPREAVLARRAEDRAVLESLGAQIENWEYYDAIYREAERKFLYTDHQKLFGPIHPAESALIDQITERLMTIQDTHPEVRFFAPLRVGGHVDHLITRACAVQLYQQGASVAFYEDFPYVGRSDWQDEPTTVEQAIAELPFPVKSQVIAIDVNVKIQALQGYKSQLMSLFGDWEGVGMAREVKAYTAKVGVEEMASPGHFERYWYPQNDYASGS